MWSRASTKRWRRLATGAGRRAQGAYLVEGVRALEEASRRGLLPREVVVRPEPPERVTRWLRSLPPEVPVHHLAGELVARLSQTVHDQGLLACFALPTQAALTAAPAVVLDGLQDPGNVGTVARHAAAFGAGLLLTLPGCADPFGPKAVRASMGGLFSLGWRGFETAEQARDALREAGYAIRVLRAEGGAPVWTGPLPKRLALVVGGEARGPDPAWDEELALHIPQSRRVESCNAAFAASLVLAYRYGQGV